MFLVSVCENKHLQPPIYHPIETIEAFGHDDRSIYQNDRNNIPNYRKWIETEIYPKLAYRDKGYAISEGNEESTDSIRRHQNERFPIKKGNGHSFQPAEIKKGSKNNQWHSNNSSNKRLTVSLSAKFNLEAMSLRLSEGRQLSPLTIKNFLVFE